MIINTKQVRECVRQLGIVPMSSNVEKSRARNGENLRNMIFFLEGNAAPAASLKLREMFAEMGVTNARISITEDQVISYLRVTGVQIG